MTPRSLDSLKQCRLTNLASDDGIEPTRLCMLDRGEVRWGGERREGETGGREGGEEHSNLFPPDSRRKDVDEENMKFLRSLPGQSVKFKAIDTGFLLLLSIPLLLPSLSLSLSPSNTMIRSKLLFTTTPEELSST